MKAEEHEKTVWDEELKGKKREFVLFYCTDIDCFFNGTRAYLKAYPDCESEKAAAVNASKLLRNAKVKEAVKKLLRLSRDEDDESAVYKILKLYELLSLYNPADIIDGQGGLVVEDLKELGPLACCIDGIETRLTSSGESYRIIKLANRHKAMQAFAAYLKLVRPDVNTDEFMPVVMLSGKNPQFEQDAGEHTV